MGTSGTPPQYVIVDRLGAFFDWTRFIWQQYTVRQYHSDLSVQVWTTAGWIDVSDSVGLKFRIAPVFSQTGWANSITFQKSVTTGTLQDQMVRGQGHKV